MPLAPHTRRWLVRCAKAALVVALVWAGHATFRKALADLENPDYREHLPRLQVAWLGLAGVIYLVALAPSALFYSGLLLKCSQPASVAAAVRAFYVSQVGKYAPGKAMVLVVRGELLAGRGVERTIAMATVFVETLTAMASGALVGGLAFVPTAGQHPQALPAAIGMFLLAAPMAFPGIFARVANLLGMRRVNPQAAERLVAVPWQTLAFGWLGTAAGWWMQGLALWAVLRAIGQASPDPLAAWPLHTAAVSLSVVAGFFTMIPGGLGSRDAVLTQLLAPSYGPAPAALAAVLLRLVTLVSEALVSTILYLVPSRGASAAGDPPPAADANQTPGS